MYWPSKYYKLVIAFIPLIVINCSKVERGNDPLSSIDENIIDLPTPGTSSGEAKTYSKCLIGTAAPDGSCVIFGEKKFYVYENAFNGRSLIGSNITSTDQSSLVVNIPEGFYENKNISIEDKDLIAGNILQGVSIFGVTGTFSNAALPTCNLTSGTVSATNCQLESSGFYIYKQEYGGRSGTCSISSSSVLGENLDGKCWLDTSKHLSKSRVVYPNCTLNNPKGSEADCQVPQDTYVYSDSYGGRVQVCGIDKINEEKCWVDQANMRVYSVEYCKEDPAINDAANNRTCFPTKIGNWVYERPYGGRDTNCINDNSGMCYFSNASKSQTEVNLVATNIKAGEKVFGLTGNFITDGFYWGSGAHRDLDSTKLRMVYSLPTENEPTIKPYSAIEGRVLASDNLPSHYHSIPANTDTEENQSSISVNRTGWGSIECGTLNGLIEVKISDCATKIGLNATWDGTKLGNAGQGIWKLVSRKNVSSTMYEVWKDMSTELLWSSRVNESIGSNWCIASGNSNSQRIDENFRDDLITNYCADSTNQNNSTDRPISACFEGYSGYWTDSPVGNTNNGFINDYTNQAGKAGLSTLVPAQKSNGRVFWRLPTTYDYMLANHNGLRLVLPDAISGVEWTATSVSNDFNQAWTFDVSSGNRSYQGKTSNLYVRCIGR